MRHQVAEYLVHDYLLTINCSPAAELWVFAGALNEGQRSFRNYGEGPYKFLYSYESVGRPFQQEGKEAVVGEASFR